MFGKRSATSEATRPAPRSEPAPLKVSQSPAPPEARDGPIPPISSPRAQIAPAPSKPVALAEQKSDDYYQIKTTIFSALIDTIDLAQLAQLDPDSAPQKISDTLTANSSL